MVSELPATRAVVLRDDDIETCLQEIMQACTVLVPYGKRPWHLEEWVRAILYALRGGAREMLSVPIQHYKTTTTLVAVAWILKRWPHLNICVLQYSHDKAQSTGRILREYAKTLGVKMKEGHSTITEWRTEADGGCIVMSADQSRAGYAVDILLVDDPLSERTCETKVQRDLADEQIGLYTARMASHLDSALIVASPWTDDDPIIRRKNRGGWNYVIHPAIIEENGTERAFAEDIVSLEKLRKVRADWKLIDPSERKWMAQYMCKPLPPALGFFTGEHEFIGPMTSDQYGYGFDCAFTTGIKSDWTGIVGGGMLPGGRLAIDYAIRGKIGMEETANLMIALNAARPGVPFFSYVSGPEIGIYHEIWRKHPFLNMILMPARYNKATRASGCCAAWRQGDVLVRFYEEWSSVLLAELHAFDGHETNVDDQVDALVALWYGLVSTQSSVAFGNQFAFGSPVM